MPRPSPTPERVARARRLGARVRALREAAHLSREGLARLADISSETIRKIEMGATASPEVFTLAAIMEHLDESMESVIDHARSPD